MRPELSRILAALADLPEPTHTPEEARNAADEILSGTNYEQAVAEKSWLDKQLEKIAEWFADILDGLLVPATGGGALPNVIGYLILALLFAGVIALIVWAVRRSVWRAPARRPRRQDSVFVDVEEYRSVHEWLTEAEEHEAAGRWRQGLLCRYRALVTELVDRKFLSDIAGKTAGEYVQDVRAATAAAPTSDVAPTFAAATELFEAVWYGGAASGEAERDRFAVLSARVLSGVADLASAKAQAAAAGSGA